MPPGALARAGCLAVAVRAPPASLALPAILGDRGHLGAETVGVVSPVTHVTQQIPGYQQFTMGISQPGLVMCAVGRIK